MNKVLSPHAWFLSKGRNVNLLNLDEDFIDYAYYTQLQYMDNLKKRLFSLIAVYTQGGVELEKTAHHPLGTGFSCFTMRTWRSNIVEGSIVIIMGCRVPILIVEKLGDCIWKCKLQTTDPQEYLEIQGGYPIVGIILDDDYMSQEMLKYMAQ